MNTDATSPASDSMHTNEIPMALPPPPLPCVSDDRPILGWGALLEALLKRPDRLRAGLMGETGGTLTRQLIGMALVGMAAYGVVIGLFPGGLLAAALICWPSLYILLCLSGGQQSARELTGMLASALALLVVLMAGFAPGAWIFTQSTHSANFMGGLHLLLWTISCVFALQRLSHGLAALNGRYMQALPVWSILFMVVCLQMTTTLRPIMGPFDDWMFAPRDFFLHAWFSGGVAHAP